MAVPSATAGHGPVRLSGALETQEHISPALVPYGRQHAPCACLLSLLLGSGMVPPSLREG